MRNPVSLTMWFVCALLVAQDKPIAFTGAQILTMTGADYDQGVLVVQEGKILYVGDDLGKIPSNAEKHDVSGKILMPGLVDTHSHIGGVSGADNSDPIQPGVRALDSINIRAAGFHKARSGGVTTANIMPGSTFLISGQTVYLKLRKGSDIEDLVYREADGSISGGVKFANGTNSHKPPPFPNTRAKSAALVRAKLIAAKTYMNKLEKAKDDPEKTPERDLDLEALAAALRGEKIVHHHTHRHDDILTAIRIAKEFGLDMVLHHLSEGWKVADEIAASGIPTSITLVDSPGGKLEARDVSFITAAALEKAGATVAFHTDDGITDSRLFFRMAAFGVRYGMSRQKALEALTIVPAKILRLDDRVGSLAQGKDADFLLLSGDPLSVYSKVLETWVEGIKVYDRTNPEDKLYAVGGYGAGEEHGHGCMAHGGL